MLYLTSRKVTFCCRSFIKVEPHYFWHQLTHFIFQFWYIRSYSFFCSFVRSLVVVFGQRKINHNPLILMCHKTLTQLSTFFLHRWITKQQQQKEKEREKKIKVVVSFLTLVILMWITIGSNSRTHAHTQNTIFCYSERCWQLLLWANFQ